MFITDAATPCKENDAELWHARAGSARSAKAKQLCSECNVKLACLASAIRFEARHGQVQPSVYGGLDETERRALQAQRLKPAATIVA